MACYFCSNKKEPSYSEDRFLKGFLSSSGRILPKKVTGCCRAHQRRLSKAIKLARELAMIPPPGVVSNKKT